MTRINTVPPEVLTTKHLFAEWRELPRIFTVVKKHIANGKSVRDFDIPSEYKLGNPSIMDTGGLYEIAIRTVDTCYIACLYTCCSTGQSHGPDKRRNYCNGSESYAFS